MARFTADLPRTLFAKVPNPGAAALRRALAEADRTRIADYRAEREAQLRASMTN